MSESHEATLLFGEVGLAFYSKGGKYFKVSIRDETPVPCDIREIYLLDDIGVEHIQLPFVPQLHELSEHLFTLHEQYAALEFLIDGMDATWDAAFRIEAIGYAEAACNESDDVYQFVRSRLLSRSLPKDADVDNAILFAKTSKVKELYKTAKGVRC